MWTLDRTSANHRFTIVPKEGFGAFGIGNRVGPGDAVLRSNPAYQFIRTGFVDCWRRDISSCSRFTPDVWFFFGTEKNQVKGIPWPKTEKMLVLISRVIQQQLCGSGISFQRVWICQRTSIDLGFVHDLAYGVENYFLTVIKHHRFLQIPGAKDCCCRVLYLYPKLYNMPGGG